MEVSYDMILKDFPNSLLIEKEYESLGNDIEDGNDSKARLANFASKLRELKIAEDNDFKTISTDKMHAYILFLGSRILFDDSDVIASRIFSKLYSEHEHRNADDESKSNYSVDDIIYYVESVKTFKLIDRALEETIPYASNSAEKILSQRLLIMQKKQKYYIAISLRLYEDMLAAHDFDFDMLEIDGYLETIKSHKDKLIGKIVSYFFLYMNIDIKTQDAVLIHKALYYKTNIESLLGFLDLKDVLHLSDILDNIIEANMCSNEFSVNTIKLLIRKRKEELTTN